MKTALAFGASRPNHVLEWSGVDCGIIIHDIQSWSPLVSGAIAFRLIDPLAFAAPSAD